MKIMLQVIKCIYIFVTLVCTVSYIAVPEMIPTLSIKKLHKITQLNYFGCFIYVLFFILICPIAPIHKGIKYLTRKEPK